MPAKFLTCILYFYIYKIQLRILYFEMLFKSILHSTAQGYRWLFVPVTRL